MHEIDGVIVSGGKVILSHLPFVDGQRLHVSLTESETDSQKRRSIQEVRRMLKNGVEKFDQPFDSAIPEEDWEMLR